MAACLDTPQRIAPSGSSVLPAHMITIRWRFRTTLLRFFGGKGAFQSNEMGDRNDSCCMISDHGIAVPAWLIPLLYRRGARRAGSNIGIRIPCDRHRPGGHCGAPYPGLRPPLPKGRGIGFGRCCPQWPRKITFPGGICPSNNCQGCESHFKILKRLKSVYFNICQHKLLYSS